MKCPTCGSDGYEPPTQEWPEGDRWLLTYLSQQQHTFNGHHLPNLMDHRFWDDLSEATNGIDQPFIAREFAKMSLWLTDNPKRYPTPRGVRRFVAAWLERAAEHERKRG